MQGFADIHLPMPSGVIHYRDSADVSLPAASGVGAVSVVGTQKLFLTHYIRQRCKASNNVLCLQTDWIHP